MPRGGWRGGGRPKGTGRYQEETKPIRIPLSRVESIYRFLETDNARIPLYRSKVPAGFPSPADDDIEAYLDLNTHLIPHPASTFMVRASGNSMINAGIFSGDILIVDRSLEAQHGKVVIAAVQGELTVKRLFRKEGVVKLMPENPAFEPVDITHLEDTVIWGVVTHVIHQV